MRRAGLCELKKPPTPWIHTVSDVAVADWADIVNGCKCFDDAKVHITVVLGERVTVYNDGHRPGNKGGKRLWPSAMTGEDNAALLSDITKVAALFEVEVVSAAIMTEADWRQRTGASPHVTDMMSYGAIPWRGY